MAPPVVLNVAEKPSVARALASVFSQMHGSCDRPMTRGEAAQIFVCDNVKFPSIWRQGDGNMINGPDVPHTMITTSVRGHLASTDFGPQYGWSACPPLSLFTAPIDTLYRPDMEPLVQMLHAQARNADALILWLDCDREGEAIGDEVRTVCVQANPRLMHQQQQQQRHHQHHHQHGGSKVYRAKFSTVLPGEIQRALRTLGRVNEAFVQAVQARSEIDLRVGAAFTRFQTLRLQRKFDGFSDGKVVSYGPCQFPTLGFVVERWARIETFVAEDFWFLEMTIRLRADGSVVNMGGEGGEEDGGGGEVSAQNNLIHIDNNDEDRSQPQQQPDRGGGGVGSANPTSNGPNNRNSGSGRPIHLSWKRGRLYDRVLTMVLYESCLDAREAVVTSLTGRPKNKWRPVPLATVELQKRASRYLRIGSESLMTAAEELYQQGYISYPRTETERFRPEFEHLPLIQSFQGVIGEFGEYATKLLSNNNFQVPRAGQHDDNAHPPITPCKAVDPQTIPDPTQRGIYTLVVKHYLACCSRDAIGKETTLTVKIASEEFTAKGLMILERNWLEIYAPWERWSTGQGELPRVQVGSRILPTSLLMKDGRTTAPAPISEVELISLMDRNGIGTDATIAQHISTIQERTYATKDAQQKFHPTKLGIALVEGYNSMGYQLNKPDLRREMEAECNLVASGRKTKEEIMAPILDKMLECFNRANAEAHKLDEAVSRHFNRLGSDDASSIILQNNFSECGVCRGRMSLKQLANGDQRNNQSNRRGAVVRRKILYCPTCCLGLTLPRGELSAMTDPQAREQPFRCPICLYQVVRIQRGEGYTGNGYQICPKCFSDPPMEHGGSTSGDFQCFACTHPSCALAGGTKGGDIEVYPCPFCLSTTPPGRGGGGVGKVTLRKNSRGYILSCSNYVSTQGRGERCQYTVWLPKAASSISVPEESQRDGNNGQDDPNLCERCSTRDKIVRKIKFVWKPGSVPPHFEREYIGCVLCDEMLRNDMEIILPTLNQVRTRRLHNMAARPRNGRGTARSSTRSGRGNLRQRSDVSFNNNTTGNVCFRCGQPGHYAPNCPNN